MSKWLQRKDVINNNIKDTVINRTGLSEELLLVDKTVYIINNLQEAADLTISHFKRHSKIIWHTDYDADGICCGAEARELSAATRYPMEVNIPKRFSDGYGIKMTHIEKYHKQGCNLLILADNGIAAIKEVERAIELGMDVIILDHHQEFIDDNKQAVHPKPTVLVDPHVTGGTFTEYCGAGLVLKFAEKIMEQCNFLSYEQKVWYHTRMEAFAAIATVADVVPMTGENRRIVKRGISNIMSGFCTAGLKELMTQLKMLQKLSSSGIAFYVAPVFNAYGRLDDNGGSIVADTVLSENSNAEILSQQVAGLIAKNNERKDLQQAAVERAKLAMNGESAEDTSICVINDKFILIIDKKSTPGINGLTSGKLTEEFHCPSIVVSPTADETILKGSGRSIEEIDLKALLDINNEYIVAYGGHPGACGITLSLDVIKEFAKRVNDMTPVVKDADIIYYDYELSASTIISATADINKYEPYGTGNPEPVVRMNNLTINKPPFFMGDQKQHVKFSFDNFSAIWFNGAKTYKDMGSPKTFNILGRTGYNTYMGQTTVQVLINDLKAE